MKVCLLFPPISDPRGPHLAPAALAAALRKAGCDVVLQDLDLKMALTFFPLTISRSICARQKKF